MMVRHRTMLGLTALAGCLAVPCAVYAQDDEPPVVGHVYDVAISTPHPYVNTAGQSEVVFTATVRDAGTAWLQLHFDSFDLAETDFVVLKGSFGQRDTLRSDRREAWGPEFWAYSSRGDSVQIELWAAAESQGYGIDIDEFASGDNEEPVASGLIPPCDRSRFTDVPSGSYKGVSALITTRFGSSSNKVFKSTAFLVGENDCMLTCRHDLRSGERRYLPLEVRFGEYEIGGTYDGRKPIPAANFCGLESDDCDCAYIKLYDKNGRRAAQTYSPLKLGVKPAVGTSVRIVGHPDKLDMKRTDGVRLDDEVPCEPFRDGGTRCYNRVSAYSCGGNSGSPVFDQSTGNVFGILCGACFEGNTFRYSVVTKIGALPGSWDAECINKPTGGEPTTWGQLKSLYR